MVGPSSYISKALLTLFLILCGWYIWMDISLYMRIEYYPVDRNFHFNDEPQPVAAAAGAALPTNFEYSSTHSYNHLNVSSIKYEDVTWISCDINPLCHVTIKALMLDHTNHYLFAPMATIFDNIFGISKSTWITPNMISFFHVFVAIAAGRLIASDSLSYRRMGVVIFQLRTFLDDLDGHVARQRKNIRGERSEIGTAGFYIDGICDGLGCVALMIGIFVHLKNNPPRRGYQKLQPMLLPMTECGGGGGGGATGGTGSDGECGGGGCSNGTAGVVYKVKVTTKKVARKVLCFSGQLLLSSTGWNRYIALYQDMLERNDVTAEQYDRQMFTFRSKWFFCVAWTWRVVNVHALLHCLLLSVFCDKLWEFLRTIQYIGYVVLLVIICLTEMHVLEVQNFIYHSLLTGNNTDI